MDSRVSHHWPICIFRIILILVMTPMPPLHAGESNSDPGEYAFKAPLPLTAAEIQALRRIVDTSPEAKALASAIAQEARKFMLADPQPLQVIRYEGRLNTDPGRIADVEKLRTLSGVATLTEYWQASDDPKAAGKLRDHIRAWAETYQPTGNDVNENKLLPLFVAYHSTRSTFTEREQSTIDDWLTRIGELHARADARDSGGGNRYTKSVRLLAVLGMALNRPEWIALAREGIGKFVSSSLYGDGTSEDLRSRDTLTYHASALSPVLDLAMLLGEDGQSLYTMTGKNGGSLKKSVDYLIPYATGERTREEWVNSKSSIDQRRAEAGIAHYTRGQLYDPGNAVGLLSKASFFDPALIPVVIKISGGDAGHYPNWQTVVNAALRNDQSAGTSE